MDAALCEAIAEDDGAAVKSLLTTRECTADALVFAVRARRPTALTALLWEPTLSPEHVLDVVVSALLQDDVPHAGTMVTFAAWAGHPAVDPGARANYALHCAVTARNTAAVTLLLSNERVYRHPVPFAAAGIVQGDLPLLRRVLRSAVFYLDTNLPWRLLSACPARVRLLLADGRIAVWQKQAGNYLEVTLNRTAATWRVVTTKQSMFFACVSQRQF